MPGIYGPVLSIQLEKTLKSVFDSLGDGVKECPPPMELENKTKNHLKKKKMLEIVSQNKKKEAALVVNVF